jgi:hypothetical protein
MCQKRFKAEQIIRMLRKAEVELSKGQTVVQVSRKLRIIRELLIINPDWLIE